MQLRGFKKDIEKFSFQSIALKPDYEGKVNATLIRYVETDQKGIPVLYLHGFSDYFFHPHMAERFHSAGYNFYALELRKYGNSIKPHQHPNYCKNLFEYFEEIDKAIEIITHESGQNAILMGHSNGGLISSLYANYGNLKNKLKLLILNSPFLDMGLNPVIRNFGIPLLGFISRIFPYANIKGIVNPLYPKSLSKNFYGEWEINHDWKPIAGFPGYFSWLKAVSDGQNLLSKKSKIETPILFMHATDSFQPKVWEERIKNSDIILDVEKINKKAKNLGKDLTIMKFTGAMHDIFLSKKEVRNQAFNQVFDWIDERL